MMQQRYKIECVDIRKWLYNHRGQEPQFHSLFCDGPYETNFMGHA